MNHRLIAAGLLLAGAIACKGRDSNPPIIPADPVQGSSSSGVQQSGSPDDPAAGVTARTNALVESEPNNTYGQANTLPLNSGISGSLQPISNGVDGPSLADADVYVLTIPGPTSQQVRLQVTPESSYDFMLEWLVTPGQSTGKKRDALAQINNGKQGGIEVLAPTVLAPGKHYFRVRRALRKRSRRGRKKPIMNEMRAGDSAYRLTSTVVDPPDELEREPNNTRNHSGVIRVEEPRTGYLAWSGDSDWYKLDLTGLAPNTLLRIDLSGVPAVKSRLWLIDKSRRSLVKVPENKVKWPTGSPTTIRDVTTNSGKHPLYVEVKSVKGGNPNDKYTLTLTAEVPETAHEKEPNWQPANATPLNIEAPIDGYIGHPTDWDCYKLTAQTPKIASVVVSGVESVDLQLELIQGGKVTQTVNESPIGAPETMQLIAVGPQPAYVRLSSKDHTFNVNNGYRIAVNMEDAGDREIEPNDDWDGGARVILPFEKALKGHIHPRGDVDYYALEIIGQALDETRIVTLQVTGAQGLKLSAHLFDAEKKLITKKSGIALGQTKTITHGFTPGRYFVRIQDESGQMSNATAHYTLKVTE